MKSLRTRLLATFLLLIVISLGLFVWGAGTMLDASRFAATKHNQEGRAILLASASEELLEKYRAEQIDFAVLQQDLLALSREISQYFVILDLSGNIFVDTGNPQDTHEVESQKPEVQAALQNRVASDIRYDPDDQGSVLFTAFPIKHDQDLVGIVRLELPMSTVEEESRQMWVMLAGAAFLAAFATVLVSFWFAQTLVRPITELRRGASVLASGDLKQRIHVRAPQELEQLAGAFNFMAERISKVMEDQRAFVANAAHELRTPLTTIRLRAEALREGAKDDAAVANQFLSDIESETDRLSRLVNELLDLSRIETGLVKSKRARLSLKPIAQAVATEMTPRAEEAGLTIQINMPDDLPLVNADADQFRQVFINLIGNAIKFTPRGGRIDAHATVGDRPHQRNELTIMVHDNGVGISADDLPHIFDRFYRSDKARARDASAGSGAGLGLAIVKSIIDAHRGRVWARSENGIGATIAFSLPID